MDDDVEILVHWRAGRGIRQIARSLGRSRITVRDRVAQAEAAGLGREGPAWTAAEWRAALTAAAAECGESEQRFPARTSLEPLHDEITEALKASTMTTVWQRLCDAGRTGVSFPTFRRYVAERIRATDPSRLTVLLPDPAFGEAMEIDYGGLGGPRPSPILNHLRSVALGYDGDRWVFDATGEPQPFERPERYKARRLRDRFTSELLEEYCRALGIDVFDPAFYGGRAVLGRTAVDLPPEALSLSLEEAQTWLEITPGQEAPAVMPA